jgi:hypothetical protein
MARQAHRLTLEWATEHLNTLNRELEAFVQKQPYRLVTQFEPDTKENVIKLNSVESPPASIASTVGDILSNLRKALDQAAYALATKNGPLSNPAESSFPIVLDPLKWQASGLPQIRHIEPAAQSTIDHLQPYRAVAPKKEPLALLDALNNIDKHRLPHEIVTVTRRAEYVYERPEGGFVSVITSNAPPGGFPNQAEVGRIGLPGKASDPQLHMRFRLPCEVRFGQGTADGAPVGSTLGEIQTWVFIALSKMGQFIK